MSIISFLRPWQIRQKLPVIPIGDCLLTAMLREEAVRPAPLPSRLLRQKSLLIPNVSAGMRYLAGVIK
jgi:hypothetical protein